MASSENGALELRPPPSGTRVWLHFVGLLGVASVVAILNGLVTGPGATLGSALLGLHEGLYALVPVAAGISLGLGIGVRLKTAAKIVALSMLLMVGLDLLPPSGQSPVPRSVRVVPPGQVEPRIPRLGNRAASGALSTVVELIRGDLPDVNERIRPYPLTHDRARASYGLLKIGLLFTPFIAAGVVLGLAAWIEQRVLFRSGRDEVVAMIVIAWGASPLAVFLSDALAGQAQGAALFGDSSLWMMIAAYAPPVLVGSLGWLAYNRWHDAA